MKIIGFEIENFKGIKKAEIKFSKNDMARVHTLVGLNESGKTTLLEALHSFSPDSETKLVVSGQRVDESKEAWVPRDQIAHFTGEIGVTALVEADAEDFKQVVDDYFDDYGFYVHDECWSNLFSISVVTSFKGGELIGSTLQSDLPQLKIKKTRRAKNFKNANREETQAFIYSIQWFLPKIAYYPTFVFDFPEKIYLTGRNRNRKNNFYFRLFQDILDYDGRGYTIKEHIVGRIHRKESEDLWSEWIGSFFGTSDETKIKQVMARASHAVTELVFSKWNEVFNEDAGDKEIVITINYEKGRVVENEDGEEEEPTKHDAYISFKVVSGASEYSVDDRSLGFRWFFAFLLFTQFRLHREKVKSTIFLFDEPASNLHASAQQKLLESFPAIGESPHRLIYSTHSHYMVEPLWLEQAYIVYDDSASSSTNIIQQSIHSDSDVDVRCVPYRSFVSDYPTKTSYFQPVLDTLRVQPSKFDHNVGGLIVEGKHDYYYLRLFCRILSKDIGPVFPGYGAGALGALVALHKGWGLPVRVLFDTDKGGRDGNKHLQREYYLSDTESVELGFLSKDTKAIESVLSDGVRVELIGDQRINRTNKKKLFRIIQEIVASGKMAKLDKQSISNIKQVVEGLEKFLASNN